MSSETDHPRQRTVAELLAAHGEANATGRRRRRREPDGSDEGSPVGGADPADWRAGSRDPDRVPPAQREPRRRRSADGESGQREPASALGSPAHEAPSRDPLRSRDPLGDPRSDDRRSGDAEPWDGEEWGSRPGTASRGTRSRERPSAEPPPWESAGSLESASWDSGQKWDAADPWEPSRSRQPEQSWDNVDPRDPLGVREPPPGREPRSREAPPRDNGRPRESTRSRSHDTAQPWEAGAPREARSPEPIPPRDTARSRARETARSRDAELPRSGVDRDAGPPWGPAEPEELSPRSAARSRGATHSGEPQPWDEEDATKLAPGGPWDSPAWERGSSRREPGPRESMPAEPPRGTPRSGRNGAGSLGAGPLGAGSLGAGPLGAAGADAVLDRPTEQMPRVRDAGPPDPGLTAPLRQHRRRTDPDAEADALPDDDGGPATMIGAAPAGAEAWHQARTSRRRRDADDGGPPTQAASPVDFDDEPPAGLGAEDSGELFDEGIDEDNGRPERAAARSSRARGDQAADAAPQSWGAVIAQCIAGGVGGAALWVAFRFLWRDLPVVAVAAAVLVTVGLVVLIRAIQPRKDLRTTLFAVAVGVLVTISPVILVLLGR